MKDYINELILTVIICRAASLIAPEGERRRYVTAVCAVVTLLVIISPISHISKNADRLAEAAAEFFSADETEYSDSDTLASAAAVIFTFANERYGFDTEGAQITFYTNESGEVDELMIFFQKGSVADCELLSKELESELGVTVHVFTGEHDENGD